VQLDDSRGEVFLPRRGMLLGLGGIAKGHALDQAAARLRAAGIDRFLLSAGGQVLAGGRLEGAAERAWRIGIRDPRAGPLDYFARVDIADTCVSTSGDYERFFVSGGVRYHHILDPRTGRPSRGVRSATVVTADATLADALSTALAIMPVRQGLKLVESLPGVEALIVDDRGRVHMSGGFRPLLRELRQPRTGDDG
jgi:thiamine biosynthesis lipoprotein